MKSFIREPASPRPRAAPVRGEAQRADARARRLRVLRRVHSWTRRYEAETKTAAPKGGGAGEGLVKGEAGTQLRAFAAPAKITAGSLPATLTEPVVLAGAF